MVSLSDILAKGTVATNAFDRREKLATQLLAAGQQATNPLVAFLTGAVGSYQLGNIAKEQEEEEKKLAERAASMPQGLFEGTSMDAQVYNILATADPSSPAYKIAYNYAAQPKTQVAADGTIVTVKPDLSAFNKPVMGAPAVTSETGEIITPVPAPAPSGTSSPLPNTVNVDGTEITTIQGNRPSSTDKSTLKEVKSGADTIKAELKKFSDAIDSASNEDFLAALGGGVTEGGQKLTGLWTTTALSAKGKALLDLGVLNGPDLEVMQRMLPNPSSLTGSLASKKAYKQAIKNVESFIDDRVKAYEMQYGQQLAPAEFIDMPNDIPASAVPQTYPPQFPELQSTKGKKIRKYNPKTGKIE